MPQESKKPIVKDEVTLPVDLEQDQSQRALATQQQVDSYLQRKAAVGETDRKAFQDYLDRKAEATPAAESPPTAEPPPPPRRPALPICSTPTASATSACPEATVRYASRNAVDPVAQAFATLTTGSVLRGLTTSRKNGRRSFLVDWIWYSIETCAFPLSSDTRL